MSPEDEGRSDDMPLPQPQDNGGAAPADPALPALPDAAPRAEGASARPPARPSQRRGKWLRAAFWGVLALELAAWVLLAAVGERSWLVVLLALGPRWVLAVPVLLLVPALWACRRRPYRRLLAVWTLAAVVAAGPVMGFCVPWRRALAALAGGPARPHLRVLTCNTHGLAVDVRALAGQVVAQGADVVVLQEWGPASRPGGALAGEGWHVLNDGELRVESRYPLRRVARVLEAEWGHGQVAWYEVEAPGGPVPLIDVHLASPHDAISAAIRLQAGSAAGLRENIEQRRRQAAVVAAAAREAGDAVVLAGDFNLTCDSQTFGSEFGGYAGGYAGGYTDAFSEMGFGFGWTYRRRSTRVRIDHVLSGRGWRCRRCWVGLDVGSPHRPLIAELERA